MIKLGKIFICINILVLSLLNLTENNIIVLLIFLVEKISKLMIREGIIFAASTIRIPYYDYDKITPEYMTELISSCSENKK